MAAIVGAGICVNQVLQDGKWNWWALGIGIGVAAAAEGLKLWLDSRAQPAPPVGDRSVTVGRDLSGVASLGDGAVISQTGTPPAERPAPAAAAPAAPVPGQGGARSVSAGTLSGIASLGNHASITQTVSHHHEAPVPPPSPAEVSAPGGLVHVPVQTGVFVGREGELERLGRALGGPGPVVVAAVAGLGGVGKSTLAAHYALQQARAGRTPVWWITADTPTDLESGLADLAVALQPETAGSELEVLAGRAVLWLASHDGWLLVLDNVADPADIAGLVARLGSGRIVVTSRLNEGWHRLPGHHLLYLNVLTHDEAVDLLTRLAQPRDPDSWAGADELVGELGWLPLAIDQAGAYLHQTRLTPADYLGLLREQPAVVFDRAARGADAERTIARIWRLTLDHLAATAPLAGDLLRILAWFAPDTVPRTLLAPLADTAEVSEALGVLAAYNMITLTGSEVSVHRLVQTVARTPDPTDPHRRPADIDTARDTTTRLLNDTRPRSTEDPADWPAWRILLPHIHALLDHADPATDTATTSLLTDRTASFLEGQGALNHAIAYYERGLATDQRLQGDDHPDTLASRNNLAGAYETAGDLARAIPLYEQTLTDCERVLGDDHPSTLTSRNNLAYAYRSAGDLARAIPLYEQTLTDRQRILGDDHPDTLTSRNNLAGAYRSAGDLARAIPLYEQTLTDCERVLGANHPTTRIVRENVEAARAAGEVGGTAGAGS
ncbi:tetratricopeptide repeat protein [Actinocorallia aurea]